MARIGIGIDCGADAVKVVAGLEKAGTFQVLKALTIDATQGDPLVELGPLLAGWGIRGDAVLGVTGRDMIIRYTQIPAMPDWRLRQVMDFEIADLSVQSGGDLSADFNRLDIESTLSGDETILLTLIKNSLIQERTAALEGGKITVGSFTPNAIALYNLLVKAGEADSGTAMVVNIGAESMDIAILRDGTLIFARNVSGGSRIFNQALVESFSFSEAKAEKLKKTMGRVLVRDDPAGLKPQEEKLARSLSTAAGRIYSMIQSSLMFCKAQIKVTDISLDHLYLTGGGARLRGLPKYLGDNLGVAVDLLDPAAVVDLSPLDSEAEFVEQGLEYSTAVGLAIMSVFDDVYSIQVLPESVKKKKLFYSKTIYGVFAAAILVLFLAADFFMSMENYGILKRDKTKIVGELRRRQTRTRRALDLQKENEQLVQGLTYLEQKTIAGTGLTRVMRIIQEYITEDLWIRSIKLDRVADEESAAGRDKKVVIRVEGGGRERGRPLQMSYTEFTRKLRADPMVHHLVPQATHDVASDFSFVLQVVFTSYPETGGEGDEVLESGRAGEEG
jgi:type IV pilus assembly protein PilM